jgi:hypothetical protein
VTVASKIFQRNVFADVSAKYEEESVNRSQMDIKRETCDIRIYKEHFFLDIYSTNIDTLVSSLHQCVATRSIEVF